MIEACRYTGGNDSRQMIKKKSTEFLRHIIVSCAEETRK
jgi:hypothetical protein